MTILDLQKEKIPPKKEQFVCGGLTGTIHWDEPGEWRKEGKVLTCTMCGGIKRSDLLRLIKEGAYIEPSTKRYKMYFGGHDDCGAIGGAAKYYNWHHDDKEMLGALEELFKQLRAADKHRFSYRLPQFIPDELPEFPTR